MSAPGLQRNANKVRSLLVQRGYPTAPVTDAKLIVLIVAVLTRGGTTDDVVDAICMPARPLWVRRVLGDHPHPPVEMQHPDDRARPGNW